MVAQFQADFDQESEESRTPSIRDRSIFRADALERHSQNQDRAVYPRLLSPRGFRILWIAAVLFLVAGVAITFWPLIGPLLAGGP